MFLTATVGVVGAGAWGQLILRDLRLLGREVVVHDASEGQRNACRADGHEVVDALVDLVPRVSGFIVATPASTHFDVVSELIDQTSSPIFVEKPFTTRGGDAIELVERAGDRLFVMHTWRHHAAVRCLGEVVASGAIGTLRTITTERSNWTSPRNDVDALWTLLPHDFSIALELTGNVPTPHSAHLEHHDDRVVAATVLAGSAASVGLVSRVSVRNEVKVRTIHLSGSEGVAVFDGDGTTAVRVAKGWSAKPDITLVPFNDVPALRTELDAICSYLDNGGPPPCSPASEAEKIVAAVERVREIGFAS